MSLDLIVRSARLPGRPEPVDIGLASGRVAVVAPAIASAAPEIDACGRLAIPGFVETHFHLDKSLVGTDHHEGEAGLSGAIARMAELKRGFTEEDIYARGAHCLERAISHGTTRMRTHVEVDPRIGLRGFHAIERLKRDYAWGIDLEICVFPQEGMTGDPGAEDILVRACELGAGAIGGCPYTDRDPMLHIHRIFEIARRFDLDIDFHLDFDLDPSRMALVEVCRQAHSHGWGGRVAVGHATKLSVIPADRLDATARRLRDAGVAVTVLPATDLFLMGRGHEHSVPRGVAPAHRLREAGVVCSIATNNVRNLFTPYGDCSLLRIANIFANVMQIGSRTDLAACFAMITVDAARLMNLDDYRIEAGGSGDIVLIDAADAASAVGEIASAVLGIKNGRVSFTHPAPQLSRPAPEPVLRPRTASA